MRIISNQEMLAEAEKIADLFGLEITSLYTEPTQEQIDQIVHKMEAAGASEEEIRQNTSIYRATAECRCARIEVQNDGHIVLVLTPETAHLAKEIGKLSSCESFTISFKYGYETIDGTMYSIGLPLPEGYSFTYNTTYEQAVKITQYLFSEFGSFLGTTEPGYMTCRPITHTAGSSCVRALLFLTIQAVLRTVYLIITSGGFTSQGPIWASLVRSSITTPTFLKKLGTTR